MERRTDHLDGLNERQKEAASHTKGPLLVVAGAGAGKTKTITHRIINLVKSGVPGERILAVTFTNKAAKEMRERIFRELEKNSLGGAPFVSTFHALGVHIIKENARTLGLNRFFTILDEDDAKSFIKEALKELGEDPKQYPPGQIRSVISKRKGDFVSLERFREQIRGTFEAVAAKVWEMYEEKKKREGALDFDDLLLKTVKLLRENEDIRKKYQEQWEYVHIDEYQDTNEVQYLMSRLLAENHKNICVVGDADQNIYSWRGANLKNILNFEKDYPGTTIVMLEENYRSTGNILEAANAIIKKNKFRPEKNLFTKNKTGEKISLYEALDEGDEADFVATKILELNDISEVAVLYRANFQSRALEEAMLNYNIAYQVLGVKFFERREIKDTLAYLRAALNPESLSDIKRIINFPARGIGKATLAKIFAGEKENLPAKVRMRIESFYTLLEEIRARLEQDKVSEIIKFAVQKSGIERELSEGTDEDVERLENIKELATIALKYDLLPGHLGVEKLLEDAALASDQDSLLMEREKKEEKKGVKLMTVHASKGLEFKYVFVVGLEDGLFPHRRDGENKNPEDREEERRLFYVALTRAKEKLFLSFANFRTIFGSRQINAPSEFITDIPERIIENEGSNKLKTIYI